MGVPMLVINLRSVAGHRSWFRLLIYQFPVLELVATMAARWFALYFLDPMCLCSAGDRYKEGTGTGGDGSTSAQSQASSAGATDSRLQGRLDWIGTHRDRDYGERPTTRSKVQG